jgi:hypothetical protein
MQSRSIPTFTVLCLLKDLDNQQKRGLYIFKTRVSIEVFCDHQDNAQLHHAFEPPLSQLPYMQAARQLAPGPAVAGTQNACGVSAFAFQVSLGVHG